MRRARRCRAARWLADNWLGADPRAAADAVRRLADTARLVQRGGAAAWVSLGYVSLFSMLVGFIFWYRGLAAGGIAAVGQLQLLQPFLGLALAASLLNEHVSALMLAVTLGVILCVACSKKFAR